MDNLKVGDKVRFLDAVGGGVITAFKGKDKVLVLEEDGFETPVLKRKCVIVNEPEDANAKKQQQNIQPVRKADSAEFQIQEQVKVIAPKPIVAKVPETREGEIINLYLAFLPEEGKSFTDSCFESYLINDSNYRLLFNFASCGNKTWKSRFAGEIEPNSKIFLEAYEKENLTELEKVSFQCIAFKQDAFYSFQDTYSVELRLDTVKFYKLHCFKENEFFDEEALIYPLVRNGAAVKEILVTTEDIIKSMHQKDSKPDKSAQTSKPAAKKEKKMIEVDLHIATLLDSNAGMSNADILNYQMDVFNKTMKEYRSERGMKIVFIHGKGDGVLRAAILKELKANYKGCSWQDASFKEYGFGATLVTVH